MWLDDRHWRPWVRMAVTIGYVVALTAIGLHTALNMPWLGEVGMCIAFISATAAAWEWRLIASRLGTLLRESHRSHALTLEHSILRSGKAFGIAAADIKPGDLVRINADGKLEPFDG